MGKGKLIVTEGLDGSGKATQTQLLAAALALQGRQVRQVSFPDYASASSALVKMYLGGDFGSRPEDVNPYAASCFYAVDRYASFRRSWGGFYRDGGIVLADRYTTSNAIHQCAKLARGDWPEFTGWLENFEYTRLGVPRPDLVVYLDVEPKVSQDLLAARYAQKDGRDIHERDIEYLRRCREAARWCAGTLGWQVVACSPAGRMRSKESIAEELLSVVGEAL